eukprot:GHVS01099643.1.p1 GENE.GHVS01099643.1~~GHVS01099643.1.p1  ORF type:complete len:118 (-),score=15.80 GHVS01099643.1:668-1021(-)
MALHPARRVSRGDIIVYYLSEWQRRKEKRVSGHNQYTSDWSLPHVVVEAEGHRVFCRPMGERKAQPRQIPLRLVRLLRSAYTAGRQRRNEEENGEEGITPIVVIPHTATSSSSLDSS